LIELHYRSFSLGNTELNGWCLLFSGLVEGQFGGLTLSGSESYFRSLSLLKRIVSNVSSSALNLLDVYVELIGLRGSGEVKVESSSDYFISGWLASGDLNFWLGDDLSLSNPSNLLDS
jgi:hypothetical protein